MNKKNKKVLIVGSDLSVKGGITSVIYSFLNYNWDEFEVELFPTYIEKNSINKIIFFVKSYFKYIGLLLRNEFNIAHVHMSYKGSFYRKFIIVKTSKIFKKKVVLHLHGSEFKEFYNSSNNILKKLIKNIFESSDCVIVLGEEWYKLILNIAPTANIKIFNNAVKIPNLNVTWNKKEIKVLFLGVLIKRKGVDDLIEAIKILEQKNIIKNRNIKFIIAGTGKEEYKLKEKAKLYKLENCIDFVGWVNGKEKEKLLKESQVFVLPSYNEGLPVAILEAMAYGIPVISTNVGSIEEVVNNDNGFIIKPGSINDLAYSIEKLTENEEKWNKKSNLSRKTICKMFDEKIYFENIINLYNDLIKNEV